MWDAAERHPARTLVVFTLTALVVVDGARRTLAGDGTPSRPAPLIAGIALSLTAIPMSMFVRARPEFTAQRTQMLLAVAWTPIVLGVAAAALGANSWLLWACLALAIALCAWWVRTDGRSPSNEQSSADDPLNAGRSG